MVSFLSKTNMALAAVCCGCLRTPPATPKIQSKANSTTQGFKPIFPIRFAARWHFDPAERGSNGSNKVGRVIQYGSVDMAQDPVVVLAIIAIAMLRTRVIDGTSCGASWWKFGQPPIRVFALPVWPSPDLWVGKITFLRNRGNPQPWIELLMMTDCICCNQ